MKYILPVIIFKVKINNTGKIQISPNKMITILNSSFKKKMMLSPRNYQSYICPFV